MNETRSTSGSSGDDEGSSRDETHGDSAREARALRRMIRASVTATMLCNDRATQVRYVIDGASGAIVCPVESELLGADDYTLLIPDESFDALQVHVAPMVIDQRSSEACDRHLAYHGVQEPSSWVGFQIFSAKGVHPSLGPLVADGVDLMTPNLLRAVEPRLCKMLNSDPGRVAELCKRAVGVVIERPLVVGVDADGMDVRAKFGIVRVEFDLSIMDADSAAARLERMLGGPV